MRIRGMARHDYDLPADYEQRVEDDTMSEWYTEERARRQAKRQGTLPRENSPLLGRVIESVKRRAKAKASSVSLKNWR